MSAIITDSAIAPKGYKTSYYNEFYVHYDPTVDRIEQMIANANSGDDRELLAIARQDTPQSRTRFAR
jgi:hypothetical protein